MESMRTAGAGAGKGEGGVKGCQLPRPAHLVPSRTCSREYHPCHRAWPQTSLKDMDGQAGSCVGRGTNGTATASTFPERRQGSRHLRGDSEEVHTDTGIQQGCQAGSIYTMGGSRRFWTARRQCESTIQQPANKSCNVMAQVVASLSTEGGTGITPILNRDSQTTCLESF